jgi:hypothetical protein
VPTGKGMKNLRGNENRHWRAIFWGFSPEKREEIRAAAERYYTACDRFKLRPDPSFFPEVLSDAKTGKFQDA